MIVRALMTCVAVLLAVVPARAQSVPFEIAGLPVTTQSVRGLPDHKLLTQSDVERALNSYPDVRGFADRHEAQWKGYQIDPQSADPIGDARAKLSADGSLGEFENIVRRFGFSGYDDWTRTAFSIAAAFGFEQTPLAAADTMPPETREMMFAQMPELRLLYDKLEPPQANVSVVAPYATRIQAIIDAQ